MKIEYEDMSKMKEINLPELMIESGVRLASNHNGTHSFYCPFHKDTNPSLKVNLKGSKWLWHCFGCGEGGNTLSFIMKHENVSLKEACEKLKRRSGASAAKPIKNDEKPHPEKQKLINKVVEYYHKSFYECKEATNYLTKRGITDNSIYETFRLGYAAGNLHETIPRKGEVIDLLKEAGILTRGGKEHFKGCIIFPIYDTNGNCVEIYGRRLGDKEPTHLYLN